MRVGIRANLARDSAAVLLAEQHRQAHGEERPRRALAHFGMVWDAAGHSAAAAAKALEPLLAAESLLVDLLAEQEQSDRVAHVQAWGRVEPVDDIEDSLLDAGRHRVGARNLCIQARKDLRGAESEGGDPRLREQQIGIVRHLSKEQHVQEDGRRRAEREAREGHAAVELEMLEEDRLHRVQHCSRVGQQRLVRFAAKEGYRLVLERNRPCL
mmetsp:Transcript_12500/g.28845  ORF Transcript_12500/g.28845 Transcript_12500/m.28845 type:complete len:212 (-) Transcript_12500:137-772(-)